MNRSGSDTPSDREYVRVAILESMIEAQLMASVLNDRQIPHRIQSYHDTAYDGLFQVQKGWGEIRAPATFLDRIMKILDTIRASGSSS
jgi:hypothetical protein